MNQVLPRLRRRHPPHLGVARIAGLARSGLSGKRETERIPSGDQEAAAGEKLALAVNLA